MAPIEQGHQQHAGPSGDGKAESSSVRKFQVVLEEGHAAAGTTLFLAVSCGLLLGFALPKDPRIPDPYSRVSSIVGWMYFGCWWIGWYPQLLQNALSRTVVGISFDQALYNLIGFACYSTFNCALFFNAAVQRQYREAHGGHSSDVRSNDLAFSLHCNLMTLLCIVQILIYNRGGQRVSGVCWAFCGVFALLIVAYLGALAIGAAGFNALGFLYLLSYIKLVATFIKYVPQIVLNAQRGSTAGWNVSNALTDMTGGLLSMVQQSVDAYALQDWGILTGDFVKFGLGLLSMLYCMVLAAQHYVFLGRERAQGRAKAAARQGAAGAGDAAAPLLGAERSMHEDQLRLSAVV